ncbi:MAG: lysophospholipid acyltransferase family protein [Chloroflexota bacterium]
MNISEYHLPLHIRLARLTLRPFFRLLFHLLSHISLRGLENIPPDGPYLIAINHVSLYDPPFLLAFWPTSPEAAGAVDIWSRPGQNMLVRLYGGIPIHRGEYDRKVIDRMLAALQSGRPLLIAPEGGRSHLPGLRRGLPGVAYLADLAQVPVVPVGISGATDDFLAKALRGKRPHIQMHIGEPLRLPPIQGKGEARRNARQENVDLIMQHIAALLPPEYQGVYVNRAQTQQRVNQTAPDVETA